MTKKQYIAALKEARKAPRVIAKASSRDADRAAFVTLLLFSLSFLLLSLLLLLP